MHKKIAKLRTSDQKRDKVYHAKRQKKTKKSWKQAIYSFFF